MMDYLKKETSSPKNGINVDQLRHTILQIEGQPTLSQFVFRAQNQWDIGTHSKITLKDFHGADQEFKREQPFRLEGDEPPVLLGKDQAPSPVEYLLAALSTCMTTTLASHAALNGIEIEHMESAFEGDADLKGFLEMDPTVRKGLKEIRVKFKVKSDADPAVLEELTKKSPVFDSLANPVPIRVTIEKVADTAKKAA